MLSPHIAPKPHDDKRSSHWPAVRKAHLRRQPCCQVCGKRKHLNVHHIKPFHVHPRLELDARNLITLCEDGGGGCHLRFGHWWNFKSWNKDVRRDTARLRRKIAARPMLRKAA